MSLRRWGATVLNLSAVITVIACENRGGRSAEGLDEGAAVVTADVVAQSVPAVDPSTVPGEQDPAHAGKSTADLPDWAERISANFRGAGRKSQVLFMKDQQMVHAWDEDGKEKRESITTKPPPGTRQCKALRSHESQDFLLCMYWFTGPGGGRVDGILFDLKRRIQGEFFSAAVNTEVLSTLCYPETMVGPMPSFALVDWSTRAATAIRKAEIRIEVQRKGWSTGDAKNLRSQPAIGKFCECLGAQGCTGEPSLPVNERTIVYELDNDQLHPSKSSRAVLQEIAAQWGHHDGLKAWNLTMRGY